MVDRRISFVEGVGVGVDGVGFPSSVGGGRRMSFEEEEEEEAAWRRKNDIASFVKPAGSRGCDFASCLLEEEGGGGGGGGIGQGMSSKDNATPSSALAPTSASTVRERRSAFHRSS